MKTILFSIIDIVWMPLAGAIVMVCALAFILPQGIAFFILSLQAERSPLQTLNTYKCEDGFEWQTHRHIFADPGNMFDTSKPPEMNEANDIELLLVGKTLLHYEISGGFPELNFVVVGQQTAHEHEVSSYLETGRPLSAILSNGTSSLSVGNSDLQVSTKGLNLSPSETGIDANKLRTIAQCYFNDQEKIASDLGIQPSERFSWFALFDENVKPVPNWGGQNESVLYTCPDDWHVVTFTDQINVFRPNEPYLATDSPGTLGGNTVATISVFGEIVPPWNGEYPAEMAEVKKVSKNFTLCKNSQGRSLSEIVLSMPMIVDLYQR